MNRGVDMRMESIFWQTVLIPTRPSNSMNWFIKLLSYCLSISPMELPKPTLAPHRRLRGTFELRLRFRSAPNVYHSLHPRAVQNLNLLILLTVLFLLFKILIGWNKYRLFETHAMLIWIWRSGSAIENGNHAKEKQRN